MSFKNLRSVFPFFVPALIVVIACIQLYLANVYDLTQWKGGGFGMFSTVDSQRSRFLRSYLLTDVGESPIEIPSSMERLVEDTRLFPTQRRMLRLTRNLAQSTWVPYDYNNFTTPPDVVDPPLYRIKNRTEPDPTSNDVVNLRGVRLEVWSFSMDLASKRLNAYMISEITLKADGSYSIEQR